ncbi:MAG: AAA family ATPase [Sphaerochaetaceae bacterium]|nr:AAA family ATPase [Sphaerochaetaceae bacterium]
MERLFLSKEEASFEYDSTFIKNHRNDIEIQDQFIGQPRALKALRLGMSLVGKNYNIFISGEDGSGRHRAVFHIAKEIENQNSSPQLHDLILSYNFFSPSNPDLLILEQGKGKILQEIMKKVVILYKDKNFIAAINLIQETLSSSTFSSSQVTSFLLQVKNDLVKQKENPTRTNYIEKFKINLICDKSNLSQRPLIVETHPSPENLFGKLETGSSAFPHLSIRGGSIFEAEEGYLVIDADEMLSQKGLWDGLKKFLDFGSFMINGKNENVFIKINRGDLPIKVILIGSDSVYDKLCEIDDSFLSLFTISAEFDFSMKATERNIILMTGFIDRTVKQKGLLPIDENGIAKLLFYSSWYAEQRNELTTKLSFITDLLMEADYWAKSLNEEVISSKSISKAMNEREYINSLTESRINEEIINGEMIISLKGYKTGVINGLAIMDRGSTSFGTPTVISATVAPGTEGIVNIEHEAGLSGEIHDKGLLILEGYLRERYAKSFPLSIYAGICFEQSYAEVDGDSASSSELFALLSAIGSIPVRQDIAITGSVNQLGFIQPVGGINEKITGFYKICNIMGLTGHQGVIIPKQNVNNLLLSQEIIQSISEGKFHIYPISTIDKGMEILSHRESGERTVKGTFPPNTFNRDIEDRLKKLFTMSRNNN